MSIGTKALKGPKASKGHKTLKVPNPNRKVNHGAQENCGDPSGTVKRPKHEKKAVLVLMASANGPENVSARNKGKKNRKKKEKKSQKAVKKLQKDFGPV